MQMRRARCRDVVHEAAGAAQEAQVLHPPYRRADADSLPIMAASPSRLDVMLAEDRRITEAPLPSSGTGFFLGAMSSSTETSEAGRRAQTKARNREAILAAARRVFAEQGYEAASVRDIIRRTDLASGTFYNYFRSKEAIARALAADAAHRLRPLLRAEREKAVDLEAWLDGAIRAYFDFLVEDYGGTAGSLPHVRIDATPAQRAVFEEIRQSLTGILGDRSRPRPTPPT